MLEVTRKILKCVAIVAVLIGALSVAFAAPQTLGSYNVKIDETSVSGISSGADMAVQFGVAHSALVTGVGAIAGSPYYCAQGSSVTVLSTCMIGSPPPDVKALKASTDQFSRDSNKKNETSIDETSHLATQKVWLFTGYNDGIVKSQLVKALFDFYRSYTGAGNIYFKEDLPAAHALLTTWSGAGKCDYTGGDFLNKCKGDDPAGYDAAGLILQHIYGKLNERNNGAPLGKIIEFSQREFFSGSSSSIGMADTGYVYVPQSCANQQPCRVHIAFHGCEQSASKVGSDFYRHAGYNEWADTNHMIVLYPQVQASSAWLGPLGSNPLGCWDWWGYTDSNYAQKKGRQIMAVEKMLKLLAKNYTGWQSTPTGAFGPPKSLVALDSSPSRVALAWTSVAGADGYNIYRVPRSGAKCPKELPETSIVNGAIVQGSSYSDSGLSEHTTYCYQVAAVHAGIGEHSDVVNKTTTSKPPDCKPYVRSPYLHWKEGRVYPSWLSFGQALYAKGSSQFVGYWYSKEWVLLTETSPGYFVVNEPCKPATRGNGVN